MKRGITGLTVRRGARGHFADLRSFQREALQLAQRRQAREAVVRDCSSIESQTDELPQSRQIRHSCIGDLLCVNEIEMLQQRQPRGSEQIGIREPRSIFSIAQIQADHGRAVESPSFSKLAGPVGAFDPDVLGFELLDERLLPVMQSPNPNRQPGDDQESRDAQQPSPVRDAAVARWVIVMPLHPAIMHARQPAAIRVLRRRPGSILGIGAFGRFLTCSEQNP